MSPIPWGATAKIIGRVKGGRMPRSDMDSGMQEIGLIIMNGGGHGGIEGRMRSHSFADATSRVPNSHLGAFLRRNTIDTIDNQAT